MSFTVKELINHKISILYSHIKNQAVEISHLY